MEDKENAVETMTADRQQQRRGAGGVMLKAAAAATQAEMLPLSSETRSSLKKAPAAAATATAVAATPRSIGGARIPFFAATPLGQRTAGDASAVRKKLSGKASNGNWKGGDGARRQKKKTVSFFL